MRILEYYVNLVDKTAARFERTDSSFERSSTVGKMLSYTIACYREIIHEMKSPSTWQTSLLSYIKKLPQAPQPGATTSLTEQSAAINITARLSPEKRLPLAEGPN